MSTKDQYAKQRTIAKTNPHFFKYKFQLLLAR